jgi:hypothetical protein
MARIKVKGAPCVASQEDQAALIGVRKVVGAGPRHKTKDRSIDPVARMITFYYPLNWPRQFQAISARHSTCLVLP